MSILEKYLIGSASFCGISKLIEVKDARVHNRYPEYDRDMLLGEKVGIVIWSIISGPYRVPLKILDVMNKIDIYFKGHKPEDYGYNQKKTLYDYYFD